MSVTAVVLEDVGMGGGHGVVDAALVEPGALLLTGEYLDGVACFHWFVFSRLFFVRVVAVVVVSVEYRRRTVRSPHAAEVALGDELDETQIATANLTRSDVLQSVAAVRVGLGAGATGATAAAGVQVAELVELAHKVECALRWFAHRHRHRHRHRKRELHRSRHCGLSLSWRGVGRSRRDATTQRTRQLNIGRHNGRGEHERLQELLIGIGRCQLAHKAIRVAAD